MKRILFISPLPPPYYGSAVSSKLCLDILKDQEGMEVENIKLNYSTKISDIGKINFNKLFGLIQTMARIAHLITSFNPEIIYFMPATFGVGLIRDSFFLGAIKMFKKKRIILHLRAQFKQEDWSNLFKKKFIKGILNCDKIILLGSELIENLHGEIAPEKISILPNAIPKTLSDSELDELIEYRKGYNCLNLLFLSTMWKFKGWFKLLEACNLLTNSGIKYNCHFVGDWPSKSESNDFFWYVKTNNLNGNVISHGQLLDKEKKSILMEANVFVLPTEFDSCPRSILEAMEYCLPVISTRVGTIPSMVQHGKTGFILRENTAYEIYEYLVMLLDVEYRNQLGKNGRDQFLGKFTLDTYRNKFIEIINED